MPKPGNETSIPKEEAARQPIRGGALAAACAPKFTAEEMALLYKAIDFAQAVHEGQKRESGEDYYIHPEQVAIMLFEMGMDSRTVIAGLLHDVIEDGKNITAEKLTSLFGEDIANMVDGVTKLTQTGNSDFFTKEEVQAENLRKMFLAIAKDVRVVIIKLTDRLHNMRTLEYCSEEKRVRKAKETLDVYAPLAHRFGMGAMKCELEDLCFMYIWPEEFKKLKTEIGPQQEEHMHTLNAVISGIEEMLKANGIDASVSGRPKHLYSIYKKLVRQNKRLDEIYDLIAVRVIVNTESDCYAALGLIHSCWRPVPGRFKDYIAMPKPNMYSSIHTTLFSSEGSGMPFEVQIRTHEMHRAAEFGIAAHWMYKEGRVTQDDLDNKLAWLREALEMENYSDTTREFVENIQKDFFSDYVYVLTPQGRIIDLVTGSTPLDFAYRIHSNIGNQTQHAKVNGAIVRLDYKLKNNDVVEIITSPNASPRRDWLKIVKTQQAKAKIRQWFKKANRTENIQRGKEMIAESLKRQGYSFNEAAKNEYFADLLKRFNMAEPEDIYAAVGYGGIGSNQVAHKLMEQAKKERRETVLAEKLSALETGDAKPQPSPTRAEQGNGIIIKGDANMVVRFARCCSPLPGDDILGYITRGRGVSIHRRDCPNIDDLLLDPERIIEAEWAHNAKSSYTATIQVEAHERTGLLMEISQVLANMNISITTMSAKTDKNDIVWTQLSFDVVSADQLDNIIKSIRKIHLVTRVYRVNV
ncbi:MAG: bifunctional (p)ppGpp synthetase/guanosine-3',5'-bis(diphosphate) 3'-pyrophosphohydrolase [Christensenellaceae bacterium]|jgi:GTP pyrophosphokinase|nr:bifunctional (p)ppGpp synthetase/guanosine-3',5'-bis(diphosphate) 3'-pyrophosphohydrolase [Christensenellaceae bacterium]